MRRFMMTAVAFFVLVPAIASAQWPPTRLKNVKAFPADMPVQALIDTMRSFTRALGVRCSYCHVGGETTPLEMIDFSSDSMPAKVKAREMIRMLGTINTDLITKVVDRREPRIAVTCATCHRGIPQPRPLQQVLLMALDAGGVDSVEKTYRSLRERYFGSASYDFGEVPLADIAPAARAKGGIQAAIRIHRLNVASVPQSGFALRQLAGALTVAGDTTGAIASLQQALTLNANDAQAKTMLDRLRRSPP